ncbi:MAG: acyltransferase [Bacteroidia bacterium]|nr:acyltransferase [Bacteroidia bacterium]
MKKSFTYRALKACGFELPSEYYNISIWFGIKSFFRDWKNNFFQQLAKGSYIFGSTASLHWIRQFYHRVRGCKIGSNTRIAEDCLIAPYYPGNIIIEDDVAISAKCILLDHKRDLSLYRYGDSIMNCNYFNGKIHLKKGSFLGVGCIIMPGVEIGEGAVVGAGSVVHKDVPPYTVAQGNPAKIVFEFPKRGSDEE